MSSTDLSGTIVGYQYYYPSLGSPDNEFFHGSQFVEGPGLEIVPPNGQPFIVDFSASDFVIQFNESFNWNAAAFNGIAFTFSSNAPFLKGVQLVNDTVFGFTSSNVSFDSSHIYVNWQGLHVNTNNILQFHLTFDQAPVAVDDSAAVAAGQVVSSNVLANDSDPESETITVQPQSVSGQYGSLTLNSDGTYSYTADNAASLKANETAHDNFSYTISDPEGLTSTATLSIAVTGSNDAPVVHGVADQQTSLPSWYYKLPNNEFIDPDGDALTYSATLANGDALPSWLAFDSVTRAFTGVPPSGFNGSLDLKVTASDGTLSSSDTFHVSFSGPAQAAPNITAVDPTNTTADVVHYLVTFQGPVTGVDTSDFLLTTSGNSGETIVGAGISSVIAISTSQYSVAVNTGSGDGIETLRFNSAATISDLNGEPLAGGAFTNAANSLTNSYIDYGLGLADFNGDGRLDAVVSGQTPNGNIEIQLGDGHGGFSYDPSQIYPLGGSAIPAGLAVGDLNNDGRPDVAVADGFGNTVTFLFNDGTGHISNSGSITVGTLPYAVAIGDTNNDGNADLIVTTLSGYAAILDGDGAGGFSVASTPATGPNSNGLITGDFNNDGNLDFATANNSGTISVLLGDGTGGFSAHTDYSTTPNGGAFAIAAGDFNDDGVLDLAVSSPVTATVSVFVGKGDGTFDAAVDYSYGNGGNTQPRPESIAVADVNGDQKLDIVVAGISSIACLEGNGDGTFGTAAVIGNAVYGSVAIADLTGDGRPDVLATSLGNFYLSTLSNGSSPVAGPSYLVNKPPTLALNTIAGDNIFNMSETLADQSVSGTTTAVEDGQDVSIVLTRDSDGSVFKSLSAPVADNSWSATLLTGDLTNAADGFYTVTINVSDANGQAAPEQTHQLQINRLQGQLASGVSLQHDTGAASDDFITSASPIAGNADPGTAVVLTIDGVAPGQAIYADSSGAWSYSPSLVDGQHQVLATESINGASNLVELDFTLDTTAPLVGTELAHDNGSSASDGLTNDPSIVGSGDPNATVNFSIDGTPIAQTVTADENGNWTFTPTGLADGEHSVIASETDAAGNTATVEVNFSLDTALPTVTALLSDDTGSSGDDTITSDSKISGSGAPNAVVSFTIDGDQSAQTVTADGSGIWNFAPSGLSDGQHTITASETDDAGNISTAEVDFTLDTTAPVVTAALSDDTGASSSDGLANLAGISGSGDANATVHFKIDGSTIAQTVTADAAGHWEYTPSGLEDSQHVIIASETDVAGNTGSSELDFTLDTTAPAATLSISAIATDSGVSSTDFLTNDTTLTLTGTNGSLAAGEKIQVSNDGGGTWSNASQVDGTHWSFVDPTTHNSSFTYDVRVVDGAGNVDLNTASKAVTLDTVVSAPTVTSISDDSDTPNDGITTDQTLIFNGLAEANSIVEVFVNGTSIGATSANNSGHWSFDYSSTTLAVGTYAITAQVTDVAGNVSNVSADFDVTIASNLVTLSDTGAHIAALTPAQIGALAGQGVDVIDATDDALSLTVAQYQALGTVMLTGGDLVTLADTGVNIAGLSAAQIGAIAAKGIDKIDATNNLLSLTAAQAAALGSVTLAAADVVTLLDTGVNIAALTAGQIGALAGNGFDKIDSTSNTLSLTAAQAAALGSVTLTAADVVTLADTGANIAALTTAQIGALATAGVDVINATDDVLSLTVAQYLALGTIALTAADVVTLADTGAHLAALTAVQIGGLAAKGVDKIDAGDDVLSLTVAQATVLGTVTLTAADGVTLSDTGAHIAALTAAQITALATKGVDVIDASDDALSLTAAQAAALGTITLTAADTVTLADTGTRLAALTAVQIGALAAAGIDKMDSSNNALSLTVAKYQALGSMTLTAADVATLLDTGTAIGALTVGEIGALASIGVDKIDSTSNTLSLTAAQAAALGSVTLTAADTVTLADTGANVAALTAGLIGALAGKGVDVIHATDNALSLTAAQVAALGTVTLTGTDTVTLVDTGANIAGLTAVQIGGLAAKGVDKIDASDDVLSLTVAQSTALGTMTLTAGDTVTLSDTGAHIAALTAAQLTALATKGVDVIDASDDALSLTAAQAAALGAITLTAADTVTLADTGTRLAALTATQISALSAAGIDKMDATNNALSLTVAKYEVLGSMTLTPGDVVTLADTGANIATLTVGEIGALAGIGVDKIDSTSNTLSLGVDAAAALGSVTLTAADLVTLADTSAHFQALTASQIGALATAGVDKFDASDDVLSLTAAQSAAMGTMTLAAADVVTLSDTGANLAALSSTQIAALAAKGVDFIDASDDVLSITSVQYQALGTMKLTAADVVTVTASANFILATNVDNLTLTGTSTASGTGNSSDNTIVGNDGNNVLWGAGGADTLTGGAGAETFTFKAVADSASGSPTTITDFTQAVDHISLSSIDGNTNTTSRDHLHYGGQNAATVANSVTWEQTGGNTIIHIDVNGDTTADMQIVLLGTHNLVQTDFIL